MVQRDDKKEDTILEYLETYHNLTATLVDFYKEFAKQGDDAPTITLMVRKELIPLKNKY